MDPRADAVSVEVDRAAADEVVFEVDDSAADLVLDGDGTAATADLRVFTTSDRAAATKTVRYVAGGGGGGGGGGSITQVHATSPVTVLDGTTDAVLSFGAVELLTKQLRAVEVGTAGIPDVGLRLWIDAANVVHDATHPEQVERWTDQSGADGFVPGTAPTFTGQSYAPNFTPLVVFADDLIVRDNSDLTVDRWLHAGRVTLFAVFTRNIQNGVLLGNQYGGDHPGLTIAGNGADVLQAYSYGDGSQLVYGLGAIPFPQDGDPRLLTLRLDPTADMAERAFARVDGVDTGETNPASANYLHNDDAIYRVGIGSDPFGSQGWDGAVAEIIGYDRLLSDDEVDVVEAYLTTKWGL